MDATDAKVIISQILAVGILLALLLGLLTLFSGRAGDPESHSIPVMVPSGSGT